ncbi:ABC transporter substrate-binding protein [Bradyrhizobium lablabi]|uniref:ABC transporter substrate-binding protein n=1 Tax=Bradyrhizobium lablabi TaxID=722472 RepID=UPI001BA623BA|nr:ABC transporter substrate-binding protein [Bradyrhizobium lablabi]MBR1123219.1 ABC transporter substrate-binding protein [Bradyrhizobium lablabi]
MGLPTEKRAWEDSGMRRREFITLLGAAAAVPSAARAQKGVPVIAILGSGTPEAASSKLQMMQLEAGMREAGLVEGRDYAFEFRWADSDVAQFPSLAAELLAKHPRAVVVSTNTAAFAVQKLSRTVPIVGTGLNTPVAVGLVASLSRPGGNVTGVSTMAEDTQLKLLEMLRETLPEARRVLAIVNLANPAHPAMLAALTAQADKGGLVIDSVNVTAPADLETVFAELSQQPAKAVFVLSDNSLFGLSEPIIARALAARVPAFSNFTEPFAQAGGLFAYSRDSKEAYQGVARLLKRVLEGAAPAELPFEQPTKFNLFINLKTAKTLGIEVPERYIVIADRVIE